MVTKYRKSKLVLLRLIEEPRAPSLFIIGVKGLHLDWLLAEKGGVCALIGEMCCTVIPNNTAPDGSFTLGMNNLQRLIKEVKDNAGHGQGMFAWLETRLGTWRMMLAKIGAVLLIVLTVMGSIFCCCISIVRSMIASRPGVPNQSIAVYQ